MRFSSIAALSVAVNMLFISGTAFAKPFEITLQSPYVATHIISEETIPRYISDVEEAAKGSLKISLLMSNTIVKETDAIIAVRDGGLDIGGVRINGFHDYLYPYTSNVIAPFYFNDAEHATRTFCNLYEESPKVKGELDAIAKVLGVVPSTKTAFFSKNAPVRSPADLKGKRVIIDSPARASVVQAWGGIPIEMNSGDFYLGLERGAGDCIWAALTYLSSLKIGEVAKYVVEFPYDYVFIVLSMNWDLYNDLPEGVRKAFDSITMRGFSMAAAADMVRLYKENLELGKSQGCQFITLTEEEKAVFMDLAAPAIAEYWDKVHERLHIDSPEKWTAELKRAAEAAK